MAKYLLLILWINISTIVCAQSDEELSALCRRADESQLSKDYLDICTYFIDHNSPSEMFLEYLSKGYQAALKERNAESIALYYSSRGDYHLLRGENEEFLRDATKAADIFRKLNCTDLYINSLGQLSYFYLMVHKPDSSRYYIRKGLALLDSPENPYITGLLHNLSVGYMDEGSQDSALFYAKKATAAGIRNADTLFLMHSYMQQAVIYRKRDQLPLALTYYENALQLAEHSGYYSDLSCIYTNIAYLYAGMRRIKEGLAMAEQAVWAAGKEGDNLITANAYLTKGGILSKKGDDKSAVVSLRKALGYFEREEYPRFFLKITNYMIPSFIDLNQVDSALYYQSEADKLYGTLPPYSVETRSYYATRMRLYRHLGEFREVLKAADQLKSIFRQNPDAGFMPFFYQSLAEAYSKMGDYPKAYQYMNEAYLISDSVQSQEHSLQISDFMVRYQTKEKELRISQLQREKGEQKAQAMRYQHNLIFLLSFLLVLVLLLLYNRQRQNARSARLVGIAKEKEGEFIALQRDTERRLTQKYIEGLESERERLAKELHDGVCNNLLALEMNLKTLSDGDGGLKNYLALLSQTRENVRSVSHELIPPAFQYANIDEMLYDYMTHLNDSGLIEFRYFSTEEVDWGKLPQEISYEIYRIVQEALNNSMKYASASCVEVSMVWKGNLLIVKVSDNGMGFDLDKKQKGIGLRTIAERVKSIGGELLIETGDGGTNIIVTINTTNK